MGRIFVLVAFLLLMTGAARAADQGDSQPACAGSTTDLIVCIKAQTALWDKKLNAAYQEALQAASQTQADQLRAAQRLWIQYRDANCLYYGLGQGVAVGVDVAACRRDMTERRAKELEEERPREWAANAPSAPEFPRAAGSWGGVVRAGPGQDYPPVGDLKEGDKVVLLAQSDMRMDDYPWFRIRFHGLDQGFMWGGILCSVGQPSPDLYQTCP